MRAQQKDTDRPIATLAAEKVLSELIYGLESDTPTNQAAWWTTDYPTTPWKSGSLILNQTEYLYSLYTVTVQDTAGVPLGYANPTFNGLKKVDVVVTWWDGIHGRTGSGQLMTTKSTFVNRNGY